MATCISISAGTTAQAVVPVHRPHGLERGGSRKVILCVDDDPVILRLQRMLLEAAGFTAIAATDFDHALDQFRSNAPDAVVLDYEMPGRTGAALAVRLRQIRKDIPLVLNSGCATVPQEHASHFDHVLPKGLAAGLLVRLLREIFPQDSTRGTQPGSVLFEHHSPKAPAEEK